MRYSEKYRTKAHKRAMCARAVHAWKTVIFWVSLLSRSFEWMWTASLQFSKSSRIYLSRYLRMRRALIKFHFQTQIFIQCIKIWLFLYIIHNIWRACSCLSQVISYLMIIEWVSCLVWIPRMKLCFLGDEVWSIFMRFALMRRQYHPVMQINMDLEKVMCGWRKKKGWKK